MQGRYWIETWGCQMNEHDSEKMAGVLCGLGYEAASAAEDADVVLLNTCAIREKAEERVYSALQRFKQLKKRRPSMILGVCGCVAQMTGAALRERAPFVDLVLGPRAVSRLPDLLGRVKSERGIVDTTLYQDSLDPSRTRIRRDSSRVKAFVTIMEGCNKTCSYCIVPTTRGREVSRPLDEILREAIELAEQGYSEIEYLGQNVNAYRCPDRNAGLGDLLRATGRIGGVRRIRFTTSHPLHLRDSIIDAMATVPEVCDFLHLPFQSGSSRVLRAMRRGYDREGYLDRIAKLRSTMPDLSLSTDVIVGFPGETATEFAETLSLVAEVRFDQMFSFIYSPRPGTRAELMAEAVPHDVSLERLLRLQALQREIQLEKNHALIGRRFEVLVEKRSRRRQSEWAGRTTSNRICNFPCEEVGPGDYVAVTITDAGPNSLKALPLGPSMPAGTHLSRGAAGSSPAHPC